MLGIEDCVHQFVSLRKNAYSMWKTIGDRSMSFASEHGVSTDFPMERRRAKKKMADEMCEDECLSGLNGFAPPGSQTPTSTWGNLNPLLRGIDAPVTSDKHCA
jgi:hypothetical protein